jgi:hypothetical protein
MTIGEAKEIIRRYQVARQGFQDFAVTQQEFDAALDLISSSKVQLLHCEQRLTHAIEGAYNDFEIENILKRQIAAKMIEMLLDSDMIEFLIKKDEIHCPVFNTIGTSISGKLALISPPKSGKK